MSTLNSRKNNVFPLLLALFIDGMGLALLFPILNDIIMIPDVSILPKDISDSTRNFCYELTIGSFFLFWFLGTAIISDLSDDVGRKKTLLLCLFGSFIGYTFAAIAIIYKSFTLLIIGRIIDGFTIGSQPIAQAAITDMSTPENKSRNIGLTLFAPSIGFVAGPLIGSFLANKELLFWFNYSVPVIFAAAISLLNMFMLWWRFDETRTVQRKPRISLMRSFQIFHSAFTMSNIRRLSLALLFLVMGWSSFFSFIALFLFQKHRFSLTDTGFYMALIGLGFGIGSSFLTRFFSHNFRISTALVSTVLITSLMILGTLQSTSRFSMWLYAVPTAAFGMVAYSLMLNLFSNQANNDSQGWIMGIANAVCAFGFAATALSEGVLTSYDVGLPLWISIFNFLACIGVLLFHRQLNSIGIKNDFTPHI